MLTAKCTFSDGYSLASYPFSKRDCHPRLQPLREVEGPRMLALGKASQHHELEVEHAQREDARVAAARARREERIERFMNPSQRMYGQDFAGKRCVTSGALACRAFRVMLCEGEICDRLWRMSGRRLGPFMRVRSPA